MIIGIDLGTTNSLVSVWRDGVATLIPNAVGEVLTPSVVSLDRSGEILVGEAARERVAVCPQASAAAFKRTMGTSRAIALGDRTFRPEELSSFIINDISMTYSTARRLSPTHSPLRLAEPGPLQPQTGLAVETLPLIAPAQ